MPSARPSAEPSIACIGVDAVPSVLSVMPSVSPSGGPSIAGFRVDAVPSVVDAMPSVRPSAEPSAAGIEVDAGPLAGAAVPAARHWGASRVSPVGLGLVPDLEPISVLKEVPGGALNAGLT